MDGWVGKMCLARMTFPMCGSGSTHLLAIIQYFPQICSLPHGKVFPALGQIFWNSWILIYFTHIHEGHKTGFTAKAWFGSSYSRFSTYQMMSSPVNKTMCRGHHPTRTNKASSTEILPNVYGGQPWIRSWQGRRSSYNPRSQEVSFLMSSPARILDNSKLFNYIWYW